MKSNRNKTLDLPLSECEEYLKKCVFPKEPVKSEELADKVFCGDFFQISPLIPDKSFSLIIADPPYNLRKNYAGEVFSQKNSAEYEEFTRKWLSEIKRLASDNASVYVCCDWKSSLIIGNVLGDYFTVLNRITWQREKGRGAKKNWKNCMEDIWFATASEDYVFNLDKVKLLRKVKAPYTENGVSKDWQKTENGNVRLTCPSNFWDDITVPFWSMPENTAHPTQKPEKLIARLILASSSEGDTVFDPFAGSGTTAVTAKKLGRHFAVIEKSPVYCAWTQIRLQKSETDTRIQGYEHGIFFK
ncbi:MAG: site-specific DNA-methyltransferase [Oscillospiraceae bacterium]|nr:site-specific DNA-methyltransferase [Oscillospiraceae bacterium]